MANISENWQFFGFLIDQTRQIILLDMASGTIKELHNVYDLIDTLKALHDYTEAECRRDLDSNTSWRVINRLLLIAVQEAERNI